MNKTKNQIDVGWAFPPTFYINENKGLIEMTNADDEIEQAISLIINTMRGERFLHPNFGTDLRNYYFKDINPAMRLHLQETLSDTLKVHEPRIEVNNVQVSNTNNVNGIIEILIDYTVKATAKNYTKNYQFIIE